MTRDELDLIRRGVQDTISKALEAPLRRLAALEAQPAPRDGRDGLPGRDGKDGSPGHPGADGEAGRDGLGIDDLALAYDGERTLTLKAVRGDVTKAIGTVVLPVPIYRGVYTPGRVYAACDSVTWQGAEWHCQQATATKPGDGSAAWTLKVKKGKDGRDGHEGPRGPQGPAGRDWQQVFEAARGR